MEYSKFETHSASPGFLLWQTTTLWRHKIKEVLTPLDLTHTQYVIMAVTQYLTENQSSVSQKAISDFSHIDVMTISKTIRLLEKKELIYRISDKEDTRTKTAALTHKGRNILGVAIPLVENVDINFFGEKEEHYTSLALFEKLIDRNSG